MDKANIRPSVARGNKRHTVRYPALTAWRRELAAGKRTATTFDALWRAACEEMHALEAEADKLPAIAAGYRDAAKRIIAAARKGRAA